MVHHLARPKRIKLPCVSSTIPLLFSGSDFPEQYVFGCVFECVQFLMFRTGWLLRGKILQCSAVVFAAKLLTNKNTPTKCLLTASPALRAPSLTDEARSV